MAGPVLAVAGGGSVLAGGGRWSWRGVGTLAVAGVGRRRVLAVAGAGPGGAGRHGNSDGHDWIAIGVGTLFSLNKCAPQSLSHFLSCVSALETSPCLAMPRNTRSRSSNAELSSGLQVGPEDPLRGNRLRSGKVASGKM